ncbi:MAG: hypothetical protein GF308_18430 [Candidatus Heimdallarchaeota archaeon]|nr:hypothetical protein [Candidatus Heimdallarchaeota archaeon]
MSKADKKVKECIRILQQSNSDKERKDAVKELSDIGKDATEALNELMKIICGRDDFAIQGIAEETVVRIGGPAIPALKKLLKSLKRKKRSKGLNLLGEIALENQETIDKILPILKIRARRDINYRVRIDAVEIIRKLVEKNSKLPKAVELLGEVLRRDRNQFVRRKAKEALVVADSHLAVNELMKSIKRKHYPLLRFPIDPRIEAANAIGEIGQQNSQKIKEALPILLKVLDNARHPAIRISVLFPILLAAGWEKVEEVLLIIAKDRSWQVRMSALDLMGIDFLNQKPSKKQSSAIIPIVKKIAREDRFELVQDSAKNLLEMLEDI